MKGVKNDKAEDRKGIFGGIKLTWLRIIIAAILIGVYCGVIALIPSTLNTSLRDICISFEVWILFGIVIIMNSESPKDSALKCFVFFLISDTGDKITSTFAPPFGPESLRTQPAIQERKEHP